MHGGGGVVVQIEERFGGREGKPAFTLSVSYTVESLAVFSYSDGSPLNAGTVDLGADCGLSFVEVDAVVCLCGVCGHFWPLVLLSRLLMCLEVLVEVWWPAWSKHTFPHRQKIL